MAIFNQGEILFKGSPNEALSGIGGKIWEKPINKSDLPAFKTNHKVISEKLIAGHPVIHVLADENPDGTCIPVEGDLEDVYFSKIFTQA